MNVGRQESQPPGHGASKQRRPDRHHKDDRPHAERIANELAQGRQQSVTRQGTTDDRQKDRQRTTQGSDRIGDAEQERVPQVPVL